MGTGFSLSPDEYRAAAGVIEGYGEMQADNGSALAAGTSTPLSSSGTGIAGAISSIAQGTVQKIVTDVTSTAKGFADDTAQGLRTQADNADRLETELAGNARSILSSTGQTLASLVGGTGYGSASTAFGGAFGASASSGATTTPDSPFAGDSLVGTGSGGAGGSSASESGESGVIGAGAAGEEPAQETTAAQFGQMRGVAGAGGTEERGRRPGYLKSKTDSAAGDALVKAAADKHQKECGAAPVPFGGSRLVCARCGSIIEVEDAREPAAAEAGADPGGGLG